MNEKRDASFSRRRFCALFAALPHGEFGAGDAKSRPLDNPQVVPPPPHDPPADDYTPPPPVFDQLFPKPTGENGYEDVVRAGDVVYQSKTLGRKGPLTWKREVFASPEARQALMTLRAGLSKSAILSPPFAPYNTGTSFGYLGPLHALSRLLALEQYVLLADGKQAAALDSLQTALRLTDVVNAVGPYGATMVVMGQKRATEVIACHLDQLSARSCERLSSLVRIRLTAPNAAIATFEVERNALMRDFVETLRLDRDKFMFNAAESNLNTGAPGDEVGEGMNAGDAPNAAEEEAIMRGFATLKWDRNARNAVADELAAYVNAAMSRAAADLRDPSRTVPFFPVPALRRERLSFGFVWAHCLLANYGKIIRFHQVARTRLQLLGVHAAIRRYRWETGRAPERLEMLDLKNGLGRDPFTGGLLTYARDADEWRFALSSVGPLPRDRWGNVVPKGKRKPVEVPEAAGAQPT